MTPATADIRGADTSPRHLPAAQPDAEPIPPLENGDRMGVDEFVRRYKAMPGKVKAELIEGQVYMPLLLPPGVTYPPPAGPGGASVLSLENGDHLSMEEFERRAAALPEGIKAELIEGVVYMAPPVSIGSHGLPSADLIGLLFNYRIATPGVLLADNGMIRFRPKSMPQPDAFLFVAASHGGQARIGEDDYLVGPPEFVAEVSASSVSRDLHSKSEMYLRHGVREYLVWRTRDRAIDCFIRRGDEFVSLPLTDDGVYRSEVFPGLWLNAAALVAGDPAAAVATVQAGVASPEHAAFVTALRDKAVIAAGAAQADSPAGR